MTTIHEPPTSTPATPARKAQRNSGASEIWDEDFVFQGESQGSPSRQRKARHGHSTPSKLRTSYDETDVNAVHGLEAGPSRTTSPAKAKRPTVPDELRAWSESPTSPRVKRVQQEENWDDDFLDRTESPVRPSAARRNGRQAAAPQLHTKPSMDEADQENWDEDFELSSPVGEPRSPRSKQTRGEAAWDTSDSESDADFDKEMGFDRDEEDRTVTARLRRRPLGVITDNTSDTRPPIPSIPATYLPTIPSGDVPEPFPRSPTHSVFSIPATMTSAGGRDSVSGTYGSTAHLRRTYSTESSSPTHQNLSHRFPPSSPPRERRRLRKKSRPPHLDASILEQDDRLPDPVFRPITPESRPATPPPPSQGSNAVISPTTPSSTAPPASPSSKSPLLTRIGSMKRWGVAGVRRKRASTVTENHSEHANGNSRPRSSDAGSTAHASPVFKAFEEEGENRVDNNKTPRPRSYIQTSPAAPVSPTKQHGRFFRGSTAGLVAEDAPAPQEQLSRDTQIMARSQSKEWKRESLRVVVPSDTQHMDLASSPRKARMRAFGQKLLPGSNSSSSSALSKSTGPELRAERTKSVAELSVEELNAHLAAMPRTPPRHPLPLSPLAGDTPTRLRPRIPHQGPASLRARPIFPRHVSGSAVHDSRPPIPPTLSGRSVSATAAGESSDDLALSAVLTNSDRLSTSTGNSHSTSAHEKEKGHRGFMGSIRRMSLVGAQKRHKRDKSVEPRESSEFHLSSEQGGIPPLPAIPIDLNPLSTSLLTPGGSLRHQSSGKMSLAEIASIDQSKPRPTASAIPSSLSAPVDLSSPTSGSFPKDRERERTRVPTLAHSKSSSFATTNDGSPQGRGSPISRLTTSAQAASLGRASPLPIVQSNSGSPGSNVYRRNSLGDLKIPTRISRAQDGLKRDLGRVREFASHVEQMINLRSEYYSLAQQIQSIVEILPPSHSSSPSNTFSHSRSSSRARSNTHPTQLNPSLTATFQAIDQKYAVAWECADLLIELGTGSASSDPPSNSNAASPVSRQNRERAVTLGGDEGKPDLTPVGESSNATSSPTSTNRSGGTPALLTWRATQGKHDLGHRQLYLLKEMLNGTEGAGAHAGVMEMPPVPPLAAVAALGWDEGMESTLTLPSEESGAANVTSPSKAKRQSRIGLTGIRDMLRMLKRSQAFSSNRVSPSVSAHGHPEAAQSKVTLNTENSSEARGYAQPAASNLAGSTRRRGTDPTTRPDTKVPQSPMEDFNPYTAAVQAVPHKSSPRRPSLASLFKIGQKHKASPSSSVEQSRERSASGNTTSTSKSAEIRHSEDGEEGEDDESDSEWDRIDSTSDIDASLQATNGEEQGRGTLKLRKKRQSNPLPQSLRPKSLFSASQTSINAHDQSIARLPRLSNVDENKASTGASASSSNNYIPATPESARRRGRSADPSRVSTSTSIGTSAFASVRTVPRAGPKGIPAFDQPAPGGAAPDIKLAMTPENIRPLLENARVVSARLKECLGEAQSLLVRAEKLVGSMERKEEDTVVAKGKELGAD